jgi:branched-chain amino acid transport system permease protein
MLGIRVTGTGAIAWAACGALAGVSGLLLATLVRLDAATLTILVVPAVAAAIIGRLESLPLVCVGGIAIGVLEAVGTPYDAVADYRSIGPLLAAGLVLLAYQLRGNLTAAAGRGAAEVTVVASTSRARRAGAVPVRHAIVVVSGAAAVIALIPSLVGVAWLATLTACVLFAVCAAGIGLLYDRLGLTSLAQVALMGVGGWTMLRLHFATDWPFGVLVALTGVITAAVAVLLGLPALRLRGLYLALVTLMIAGGFDVAFNAAGFPNGGSGFLGYQAAGELQRLPRPGFAAGDDAYFRFTVIVAGVLLALVWLHLTTRPGRAWALIRAGERAAASAGVSVVRMQSWAFALAGLLSGVAGALLAGQLGQLAPASFPVTDSLLLFGLVVIAGAHHWSGWIVAALLYKAVPFAFDEAGIDGNYATMIFGVALMLSLLGSERGIVGDVAAKLAAVRARSEVTVS